MDALTSVAVRMYYTGFGDCFLLTFRYGPDGPAQQAKTLWIDFGARAGTIQRMEAIALDIKNYVASLRPAKDAFVDVLAITHEHADHISGLKQAKPVLDQITFGQVWFAWTENPRDELAQEWRRQKTAARQAVQTALTYLQTPALRANEAAQGLQQHLTHLAAFEIDADDKLPDDPFSLHPSYELLRQRGQPVHYLSPGYTKDAEVHEGDLIGEGMQRPAGTTVFEGVRIFVLGPPKDLAVIKVGEPKQWEQTLHTATQQAVHDFNDSYFAGIDEFEDHDFWYFVSKSPFSERFVIPVDFTTGQLPTSVTQPSPRNNPELPAPESQKVKSMFAELQNTEVYQHYFGQPPQLQAADYQPWRRIDNDYVYETGSLAIKLNTGMNNTSLVLALELQATEKTTKEVLLFSGDAEYGVWNDWEQDRQKPAAQRQYRWAFEDKTSVTVEDLLSRTIFYKMGHHGSENATPKAKGINKLSHEALHSMIPVDEARAKKFCWNRIPFQNLLTILDKRKVAYVRADKSHEPTGSGCLNTAAQLTADSSLSKRVTWHAEPAGAGEKLFVEWKLTLAELS